MKLYQKVCAVIADKGMSGLFRRIVRKFSTNHKKPIVPQSKVAEEYDWLVKDFTQKALAMGYGDLRNYYWYHTIDLGNGLVTPGTYDYRKDLPRFRFPEDMSGMNVLDIGSATGFFAFEFEKRGATVTSVELPSIADWDMPLGEDRERTLTELMAYHQVTTIEEVHNLHLDAPCEFCRRVLKSKVTRCHSPIYALPSRWVCGDAFGLIVAGVVLPHTFS